MRKMINDQFQFDTPVIANIQFDLNSRHEMVPILMALQHIYSRPRTMKKLLSLIENDILGHRQKDKGAPGLDYWEILVLAAVRLGCDFDYDELVDLANNHHNLRLMMGIGDWQNRTFARSTVHDNLSKLSPDTLRALNELIVAEGHKLAPKAIEKVRGDSFVVKTNIAYPMDTRLVYTALRKALQCLGRLDQLLGSTSWRQHKHHQRQSKRQLRKIEKAARSRKANRQQEFKKQTGLFLQHALDLVRRGHQTIANMPEDQAQELNFKYHSLIDELSYYLLAAEYFCDLTVRRILQDEQIPHEEKYFSLFELHTELINRGKTPLPIEYGHRVLVVEDQKRFIVDYEVVQAGRTDDQVLVEIMTRLQDRMRHRIKVASWDKGFWSPDNLMQLQALVQVLCLPKKGKLVGEAKERESSREFVAARKLHAGIESAINALVAGNGLGLCRDKGEEGYHRYVGLAILGRNLQALGTILLQKARKKQAAKRKAA